jgi:sugar/nucleoside kinase (ribokinase family)
MNKILALSNLVTDIIRNTSDEHIQELGFEKGRFHIATPEQTNELAKDIATGVKIPGGSAANVIAGSAMLGAKTGLIGTVGNDEVGNFYKTDILKRGIENYITEKQGQSGVCHTFITPDGERTFVLAFGVSQNYEILDEHFNDSHIFHTSAYELSGSKEKTNSALKIAKEKGMKISFDLADSGIVKNFKEEIRQTITGTGIVFANEEEALEFTGKLDAREALDELAKLSEIAVVKKGSNGSLIKCNDEVQEVSIIPLEKLINTNGAGDAYAAGFLAAHVTGKNLCDSGKQASEYAARACMSNGARVSE